MRRTQATAPSDFAAALSPVASKVRVESAGGEGFRADVYAAPLEKLGLFTVRIRDAHVEREAAPYVAVTVPVSCPLEFYRNRRPTRFHPGSAHVLHTRDPLDLRIAHTSGLFVATFEGRWIDSASSRLTQYDHYYDVHRDWHLDLQSPTGQSFRHFLDFIWSETCRGGHFTRSAIAVREIEHTCATLLILASEAAASRREPQSSATPAKSPLDIAEEYLRANLTEPFALDKLIEVTGTSASTLLREFRKRHGMPPLQYLRLCRLEAAHHELMSAESDETTVTEVATHYGFYHLGRFAGRYRDTFGELPSETLKRHS